MERLTEEVIEDRPGRAPVPGGPHLAEDLALARYHRVEPGRDAEEVEGGGLVVQPVDERQDLGLAHARQVPERVERPALGRRGILAGKHELGAVAGGEADRLAPVGEGGGEPVRALAVEGGQLAQLDRAAVVRDAGEDDPHEKWVSGRASLTTITSAKPSRATQAARRPRQPAP